MEKKSFLITEAEAMLEYNRTAEWLKEQAEKGEIRCIVLCGKKFYFRSQLACADPGRRKIEVR